LFGILVVNRDPIEIRDSSNRPVGVTSRVKGIIPQLDRAILKGDFRHFSHSPYISDPNETAKSTVQGTKLISCGYPLGGKLYCSEYIFKQMYGFGFAGYSLLIPGMSGGPTMTPDGKVIAINSAVIEDLSLVSPIYGIEEEK
jgi:hypothetical protein